MIVYICYDRYENDEWINVEYIGTDKDESIRKVKEEILPELLQSTDSLCSVLKAQTEGN